MNKIYTIGQGSKDIKRLIELCLENNIEFLVDVRTNPYSKYNKDFSLDNIKSLLRQHKIKYLYMGDLLGGKPSEDEFYTNGFIDYSKMSESKHIKKGLLRLKNGVTKGCVISLFCSEGRPEQCHRSKLLGQELKKMGIETLHIENDGKLSSQKRVISKLTKDQKSLFGDVFMSRKKYK